MSNLRVATVETENDTTDLTLTTGNTSGPEIVIAAGNNDINLTGDFIVSGNVSSTNIPSGTLITETSTSTLTNKTLTDPKINVGSDATGDLYYRASDGSFERLAIGSTDQVLTVASGLPSWSAASGGSSIEYWDGYEVGTTSFSTATVVDLDTERQNSNTGIFSSFSAGVLTIAQAGTYMFNMQVSTGITSATSNRSECLAYLQQDPATGTFATVAGTDMWMYARQNGEDENTGAATCILTVGTNYKFRLVVERDSGSDSTSTEAGGSRLTVLKIA